VPREGRVGALIRAVGFFIGPCRSVHIATVTDNIKTIYKGMNLSLLLQTCL
jgi:hypothetical protein